MRRLSEGPGEPQDSQFIRTDIAPAEVFRAIGRLRKEARAEIDRLIRFLDESQNHMCIDDEDGADDETGGDEEPSLGSFNRMLDQEKAWKSRDPMGSQLDNEADDCDAEDNGDREPSLGWSRCGAIGADHDGEDDGPPCDA